MALNKAKTYPSGVAASYHKITRIDADVLGGNVNISVSSYISQEARQAGKWPVDTQTHNFSGQDYFVEVNQPQNVVELAYLKLKEKVEFFTDATDC